MLHLLSVVLLCCYCYLVSVQRLCQKLSESVDVHRSYSVPHRCRFLRHIVVSQSILWVSIIHRFFVHGLISTLCLIKKMLDVFSCNSSVRRWIIIFFWQECFSESRQLKDGIIFDLTWSLFLRYFAKLETRTFHLFA